MMFKRRKKAKLEKNNLYKNQLNDKDKLYLL